MALFKSLSEAQTYCALNNIPFELDVTIVSLWLLRDLPDGCYIAVIRPWR